MMARGILSGLARRHNPPGGGVTPPRRLYRPIPCLPHACGSGRATVQKRATGWGLNIRRLADVPPERESDAALIAGLARRDEEALRALIDACGRYVYGRALQILQEPHLAEEVAQDTLLVLWWRPDRFDPSRGTIRSFLVGIARFKAIDLVRREETIRTKDALLQGCRDLLETPPANDTAVDAVVIRAAISQLPVKKREVIFLAFYRGLSYREVAEVLCLSEGTVKSRIRDSLLRLKTVISPPEVA